jgi:hypothetical protein
MVVKGAFDIKPARLPVCWIVGAAFALCLLPTSPNAQQSVNSGHPRDLFQNLKPKSVSGRLTLDDAGDLPRPFEDLVIRRRILGNLGEILCYKLEPGGQAWISWIAGILGPNDAAEVTTVQHFFYDVMGESRIAVADPDTCVFRNRLGQSIELDLNHPIRIGRRPGESTSDDIAVVRLERPFENIQLLPFAKERIISGQQFYIITNWIDDIRAREPAEDMVYVQSGVVAGFRVDVDTDRALFIDTGHANLLDGHSGSPAIVWRNEDFLVVGLFSAISSTGEVASRGYRVRLFTSIDGNLMGSLRAHDYWLGGH